MRAVLKHGRARYLPGSLDQAGAVAELHIGRPNFRTSAKQLRNNKIVALFKKNKYHSPNKILPPKNKKHSPRRLYFHNLLLRPLDQPP
ncbi:hypothetical protein C4K38_1533 [Pseudomonas chlororaphis subsp. piscium]|nr:hypothetical protein C4K38_1533 [Pseudomonas chlororaphis subsp. piscium]